MTDPDLRFDPGLVAEAVMLAIDAGDVAARRRFHREREACYEPGDQELRDARFRELDTRWFAGLRLADPLLDLLAEYPSVAALRIDWRVTRARSTGEEGADLSGAARDREPCPRTGVIRLRVATLLYAPALGFLMRHELGHVADMIDPEFGYHPDIDPPVQDPALERLVRSRYHVAWDATVDGRLYARDAAPPGIEGLRRVEFARMFSHLGERAGREFERLFALRRPHHRDLIELALTSEVSGRLGLAPVA